MLALGLKTNRDIIIHRKGNILLRVKLLSDVAQTMRMGFYEALPDIEIDREEVFRSKYPNVSLHRQQPYSIEKPLKQP